MFRWIRAWFHWFGGLFSGAADKMQANPHVMAATYDAAIAKRSARFEVVQHAVADQMVIKEKRVAEINELNGKIAKLQTIQKGAAAMAKKLTDQLKAQNKTADEIKAHPDFIKHMAAYQDASTSLADAEKQVAEKTQDMTERSTQIANYKAELQQMQRDNAKLIEEKSAAIADTQIAQQTEQVNKVLAGIASDTTDQDLAGARQARDRAKANSKITGELVGNDAKVAESAYLEYASNTEHSDAFAALVGLDSPAPAKENLEPAKLPE